MNNILIAITFVFCLSGAAQAATEVEETPLETYQATTGYKLYLCSLTFTLAQTLAESGQPATESSDYGTCVRTAKAASKAPFDAALKSVRKAKARDALKSVHVAFLAALDGIHPASEEIRMNYRARQATLKGRLDEAWARFEVEN